MKKTIGAAAAVLLGACGGSTTAAPDPAITITSPQQNASVALGAAPDLIVPVTFALHNFTLRAPGSCSGLANCGHLHVNIDGPACTAGGPYNNTTESGTTANAKFGSCASGNQTGAHIIQLELHDDNHHSVHDSNGVNVIASVAVTTHT